MTKFINNLYKVFAYHLPETTLESISDELLKNGHIATIPYKYPIKKILISFRSSRFYAIN